jgi:hypothetical protein
MTLALGKACNLDIPITFESVNRQKHSSGCFGYGLSFNFVVFFVRSITKAFSIFLHMVM